MLFYTFLLTALYSITLSQSHTWLDYIKCVQTGEVGFPRNFVDRNTFGGTFDIYMTYQLLGRQPNDNICSIHQQSATYSQQFPMLNCPAGSLVEIQYHTNGHVISDACINGDPRGCKANGNTEDTFWYIHMNNQIFPQQLQKVSDVDNNIKFADDSGIINSISNRNKYDFNGICGDISSQPCRATFRIPSNVASNTYQFVWYWLFDRDYRGSGETYTTCFDINVSGGSTGPTPPTPTPPPTQRCVFRKV